MSLYLLINLCSLSIPLVFSFHKRLNFAAQWKYLIPAILLAMIPYIIWDISFTSSGIWGFNERYLSGIQLAGLPFEEWLFFFCIPYACLFTHHSIRVLKPDFSIPEKWTDPITILLLLVFLLLIVLFHDKTYTTVNAIFAVVILVAARFFDRDVLGPYYLTFIVMLIPFFVVNGLLTGSAIPDEIVWYNDAENMGIRMGTIPVEDTIYAFSLILWNLLLYRRLSGSAL